MPPTINVASTTASQTVVTGNNATFTVTATGTGLSYQWNVSTDGGTTFYHIGKSLQIPVENTLVMDKPINLEANDKIRLVAAVNDDSSSPDVEAYASVLEIT
jgi:hypothetical protein